MPTSCPESGLCGKIFDNSAERALLNNKKISTINYDKSKKLQSSIILMTKKIYHIIKIWCDSNQIFIDAEEYFGHEVNAGIYEQGNLIKRDLFVLDEVVFLSSYENLHILTPTNEYD